MKRFKDKVIVVTGGGSGIGEAIVRRLVSEGAKVAIIDVDVKNAERIASECNQASVYSGDVTNAENMIEVFQRIKSDYGQINGVVNNAGIGGPFIPTADYPLEAWDKMIAINLTGVFHCLRAQIPEMISEGGGAIVNMSSICGLVGQAGTGGYVATKHAIIGLTKTIALEYGKQGIRCNAVCPTYIRTPLTLAELKPDIWDKLDSRHATGHCASVEDVAAMTAFLLSDDAKSITGSSHLVDGGLTAM